jgi:hypothetical protein
VRPVLIVVSKPSLAFSARIVGSARSRASRRADRPNEIVSRRACDTIG